jgi:hypothetical protein
MTQGGSGRLAKWLLTGGGGMKSRASFIALTTIVGLLLSTMAQPRAQAVTAPQQTAASQGQLCKTADLADVVAIYLDTPSPESKASPTPVPMPTGVRNYLAKQLGARLSACQSTLVTRSASYNDTCTPRTTEDPRALWMHLQFCERLLSGSAPQTTPIPWELTTAPTTQPVIFVLSAGGNPADAATVSKLISTLTVYLNDGASEAGYQFSNNAILIPQPAWTAENFATQCRSSPNVEGAIVVNLTASGSGASDELVSRRSWTALEATAAYAQCANHAPSYVWQSNIEQQEDHHTTITPLVPLALLLSLGAIYEVFAPQRTTQTTTKVLYPSPKPPIPSTGYTSEIDTANTRAVNAAQLSGVAGTFLGSAIVYTNSYSPLTQQPAIDQQTWNSVQSLAMKLIADMNCWQPAPEPIGAPNAADIIGPKRALPGYNPPAGLGQYLTGKTSAPFCSEPTKYEPIENVLTRSPR